MPVCSKVNYYPSVPWTTWYTIALDLRPPATVHQVVHGTSGNSFDYTINRHEITVYNKSIASLWQLNDVFICMKCFVFFQPILVPQQRTVVWQQEPLPPSFWGLSFWSCSSSLSSSAAVAMVSTCWCRLLITFANSLIPDLHPKCLFVCLFCCFTSQVNSYGHGGMVNSPNHTFYWACLNKQLTSTSCTYFLL